jgi:arsenate reductase (glutaredoxin)
MYKVYYLSSCSTCKRILKELNLPSQFALQDIKIEAVTPTQLEEMKTLAGSYKALLNTRAQLYKQQGLSEKNLSENDIKNLILNHYTFLKRPVIIIDKKIFAGTHEKVVEAAKQASYE